MNKSGFSFGIFEFRSATISQVNMDVPQDVDADLENLNKCIATEEHETLISSLRTKYSRILAKIQEKEVINGITLPEDIPLSMKTSQLVAYQSPGNGDCLFNSCSRLLVGDDSLSSCL